MFDTTKIFLIKMYAQFKAGNSFPDDVQYNLSMLLSEDRKIQVAIIDDMLFPWSEALESRGFSVKCFDDISKPISQANQKQKQHNLEKFDIVICDIHGIGKQKYPHNEGLGVIEELREQYPFKVIIAYTGDPGIVSKRQKSELVDRIFSKDWDQDDFLINMKGLKDIFFSPGKRWKFLQTRLSHIGAAEHQIEKVRIAFVKSILIAKYVGVKGQSTDNNVIKLISSSDREIPINSFISVGGTAINIGGMFIPLLGN